jgi:hypothetical protein
MKIILSFFLMFICFFRIFTKRLPRTSKDTYRLFYIQHSDNLQRLYANIKAGIIDSSQPINTYRIVYTQNGKKTLVKVTKKIRLWNDFIRFKT